MPHPISRSRISAAAVLLVLCVALWAPPARAQLVVVNQRYTVVSVDPQKSIIKVSPVDKEGETSDVLVSSSTKLYVFDREIPNFAWRFLRKGMKIMVHGGATWSFKIKAKKIYI